MVVAAATVAAESSRALPDPIPVACSKCDASGRVDVGNASQSAAVDDRASRGCDDGVRIGGDTGNRHVSVRRDIDIATRDINGRSVGDDDLTASRSDVESRVVQSNAA